MSVNPKREVTGNISLHEFAQAMSKVDLSGVDPENRKHAVAERFRKVMEETVTDPDDVTYLKSENAKAALRRKGWQV